MLFCKKIQNHTNIFQLGFSLIELMVTIAIITLVTGVVLVRYNSFNNVIILTDQAYELALDIREAQVLGVSVGGTSDSFRKAYGIYITLTTPNRYLLFQDNLTTGLKLQYDSGEEIGEPYTIDSRFEITQICTTKSGVERCDNTDVSMVFKRPDFDAKITTNIVSYPDQLTIVVSSVRDSSVSKRIVLYPSGQISVQ